MGRLLFAGFTLAFAASGAVAQELFQDFHRTSLDPAQNGAYKWATGHASPFTIGFADTTGQVKMDHEPEPLGVQGVLQNPNCYISSWNIDSEGGGSLGSTMGWNFTSNTIGVSGRNYAPNTVTIHAVDKVPVIQMPYIDALTLDSQRQTKISVAVAPLSGTSTPGRLIMLTRSGGAWTQVYDIPINGPKTDLRILNTKGIRRLRWVIAKNSGSTANVAATLKIVIEEP